MWFVHFWPIDIKTSWRSRDHVTRTRAAKYRTKSDGRNNIAKEDTKSIILWLERQKALSFNGKILSNISTQALHTINHFVFCPCVCVCVRAKTFSQKKKTFSSLNLFRRGGSGRRLTRGESNFFGKRVSVARAADRDAAKNKKINPSRKIAA